MGTRLIQWWSDETVTDEGRSVDARLTFQPMKTHPLASAGAKARRAEAHLMHLRSVIDDWLAKQPFAFAVKEPRPSGRVGKPLFEIDVVVTELVPTPIEISVILGDVLTNLRAALDHIAWQLACRDLGSEPTGKGATAIAFPIAADQEDFAKCRETKLLSDSSKKFLERHQPYAAGRRDLSIVREFSNVDKHRYVHSALAVLKPELRPTIALDGADVVDYVTPSRGALRHGETFLTIVVETDGSAPLVPRIDTVPVQVVFGTNEDVSFGDISRSRSAVNRILAEASGELATTLP